MRTAGRDAATPKWKLGLLAGLLLALAGASSTSILRGCRRKEPLEDAFAEALAAIRQGDADRLYPMLFEPELQSVRLDLEEFKKLLAWSRAHVKDWRPSDPPLEVNKTPADDRYSATYRFKGEGDEDVYFDCFVVRTPEGPRLQLIGSLLVLGFQSRYMTNFHDEPLMIRNWRANQIGAEREAEELEAIGVPGIPAANNFVYSARPFRDFARRYKAIVDAEVARKSKY